MLIVNRNDGCAKPKVDLEITWARNSDGFPRSALNIVGCCPQDAVYSVAFTDEVIPQNAKILAIKLEDRVENKVPGGWLTGGCWWVLTLAVPGACFHVKNPDTLFGLDGSGVDKASISGSPNDKHAEPIKSDAAVALSSHCSVVSSVSHLIHFVSCSVKQLHRAEHFALLVDASIQIDLVVHAGYRVVDPRLR